MPQSQGGSSGGWGGGRVPARSGFSPPAWPNSPQGPCKSGEPRCAEGPVCGSSLVLPPEGPGAPVVFILPPPASSPGLSILYQISAPGGGGSCLHLWPSLSCWGSAALAELPPCVSGLPVPVTGVGGWAPWGLLFSSPSLVHWGWGYRCPEREPGSSPEAATGNLLALKR